MIVSPRCRCVVHGSVGLSESAVAKSESSFGVSFSEAATTSATTYKLQTATYGAGTQYVNRTGDNINDPTRDGLTVSTITLMEIVA